MAKDAGRTQIIADRAAIAAAAPAPPPSSELRELHNLDVQAKSLRSILESDKSRIGCFLGAGCPLGIYDEAGNGSIRHIPDVAALTTAVRDDLAKHDTTRAKADALCPLWDTLVSHCTEDNIDSPNVEHVLSELRLLVARRGQCDVDGMSKDRLKDLDDTICGIITQIVGKSLPEHVCSYDRFAAWVGGIQRLVPLEIFTPNYDLLIEEALERYQIPVFDGFVGSREPFFDLPSIEQDSIPPRWTRLWKLHGSINWQKRADGSVFRASRQAATGTAMIYPSHLKFDQSRRMPYLAMMDRLRAFFRPTRSDAGIGHPVLVVCGFSFSDPHIQEVIVDGLRSNPAAHCFALIFGDLSSVPSAFSDAQRLPNLTVLARDAAVVGTRPGRYYPRSNASEHPHPWFYEEDVSGKNAKKSVAQTRSRLGDFHYFCLFLEDICGKVSHDS